MTEYLAERTLANMRFGLSITRPGINAVNEKMALEMAVRALEKQISAQPVNDGAFGICPDCGYEFNSELLEEYDLKFCLSCGKKISMTAPRPEREQKEDSWKNHLMDRFGRCE